MAASEFVTGHSVACDGNRACVRVFVCCVRERKGALTYALARLRAPLAENDPSGLGKRTCMMCKNLGYMSLVTKFCDAHLEYTRHKP